MNKKQNPEAAETAQTTETPAVDLPRLVLRLGEADRLTNEWRKKHDAILREVGSFMRYTREASKVSLRTLAKRLGCSAPFLSDMERGNRKYSIEWCKKSLAALAPEGMNHFCTGESGSGEWSCRSEDVPSLCYYCKTPNASLLSENAKLSGSEGGKDSI